MMNREDRRTFLQKIGVLSLAASTGALLPYTGTANFSPVYSRLSTHDLTSLSSLQLFSVLDMNLPGLAEVRKALESRGHDAALSALLTYYRNRYPRPDRAESPRRNAPHPSLERAENLKRHIFQWGPYPPADYGPDIDWAADPAGDIEWVAAIYRFNWANDLVQAYLHTGDDSYAATFVELTTDWIAKHPLEKTVEIMHPIYKQGVYGSGGWKGYPWLDLQTGIRATSICNSFRNLIHSKALTPQFLGILMASLYDHQVKTEKMPMNKVHNKAIFEQRGFFNVLHTFPEYKDKERWMKDAIEITCVNLMAQTTSDGVQREWCGGYHAGVYRDVLEIDGRVHDLGYEMPAYYKERVKAMADHIFGISTPDLGFPMFGDTGRAKIRSNDRNTYPLYNMLIEATEKFKDPKYQALADLKPELLPPNGTIGFSEAGLYAMRSNWTPGQVYMALHCSPPAISSHDTPDNGTFEIYAYGRWLMPDSGFYTYGHDKKAREWHRMSRVHATLTVNDTDTSIAGRQLLRISDENVDTLCVENFSYRNFLHRRTVWFVEKNGPMPFFVIVDEAIGDLNGEITIRFPMAPGEVEIDPDREYFTTKFDDANLRIHIFGNKELALKKEDGWHAWSYGQRERRITIAAIHKGHAPLVTVSILIPFQGVSAPDCRLISDPDSLIAGINPISLDLSVGTRKFHLSRNIKQ